MKILQGPLAGQPRTQNPGIYPIRTIRLKLLGPKPRVTADQTLSVRTVDTYYQSPSKVCFKIYFTWDHFIKHKIEIADAIIVFISFILDLVFLNDDAVGGLVGKCLGSVYY